MISVIVPVYNAEKWLRRCVDSILAQTYADFELLFVDDGSTDGSGAICGEYAAQDPRVRVFHKSNGGASSARSMGLDNVRGEWIAFADADDWLDPDAFESMVKCIKADCDIVVFEQNLNAELSKEQYAERLFNFSWWPLWGKFYRRGVLDSSIMDISRNFVIGEDFFVNLKSLKNVKGKVVCKNIKKYHYNTDNPNSVNSSFQRTYEYELSMIKETSALIHALPFFSAIERPYFKWLILYLIGFMGLKYKIDYKEAWIDELKEISRRIELSALDRLALKAIDHPVYRHFFVIYKQSRRSARKILTRCRIIQ